MYKEQKKKPKSHAVYSAALAEAGCVFLVLAWVIVALIERFDPNVSSDTAVVLMTVIVGGVGMFLGVMVASGFLGISFLCNLFAIGFGISFLKRYACKTEEVQPVLGEENGYVRSKKRLVLGISSMVFAVAAIALGIWIAVRVGTII